MIANGIKRFRKGQRPYQASYKTKTDTQQNSSLTPAIISGLNPSLKRKERTSLILVTGFLTLGGNTSLDNSIYVTVQRNGVDLFKGNAAGNRTSVMVIAPTITSNNNCMTTIPISFLDDPGPNIDVVEYTVSFAASNGGDVYVNRTENDTDSTPLSRGASHLALIEVPCAWPVY